MRRAGAIPAAWFAAAALAVLATVAWPSTAHAQLVRPDPPEHWLDNTGARFGLVAAGLVDSGQQRPFVYVDFGFRMKDDDFYVDAKLGLLAGALDFGFRTLQAERLGADAPFSFIEALNQPLQYGSHLEAFSLRFGKTFTSYPFLAQTPVDEWPSPLRVSVGPAFIGELVFFDLPLANSDPAEFDGPDVSGANDPIVLGAGGFVSFGSKTSSVAYDVAIVFAQDIFTWDDYEPLSGQIISLDTEIAVELAENVGVYNRFRISTYTHVDALILTMAANIGLLFGF
jgi:hypothetical protein